MIHACCICGYRVPISREHPFDTRVKGLTLCDDCKSYLETCEKGEGELFDVSCKYLKMMLGSNTQMDERVRGYLNNLLGIEDRAAEEPLFGKREESVERL